MTRMMRSVSIALAATAIGCMGGGRGQTAAPATAAPEPAEPPAQAAAPPRTQATTPGCPMAVPGTEVAVADVPAGAALTFTTAEPNVEELRTRVHAMARMHDAHHGIGGTQMGGGTQGGMHHGEMHGALPPDGSGATGGTGTAGPPEHAVLMPPSARALAEEVEGGARLVLTAEDPADLERLRAAVRMHAAQMREGGTCEMEMEVPGSR